MQLVVLTFCLDRVERCLGCQHASFHGVMRALDAWQIHEACAASDQRAARKRELRYALQAALVNSPRAVDQALAPLKQGPHVRMQFKALKLIKRRQPRVLVTQMNHEADSNQRIIVFIGQVI